MRLGELEDRRSVWAGRGQGAEEQSGVAGVLSAMRVAGRDEVRGPSAGDSEAFLSAGPPWAPGPSGGGLSAGWGHATLQGRAVVALGSPAVALPREVRSAGPRGLRSWSQATATSAGTGRAGTQAFLTARQHALCPSPFSNGRFKICVLCFFFFSFEPMTRP